MMSTENEQKTYRGIFKATALFGGVQIYNILLTIIRTKIVAVLLGVNGVGILGLFNNALATISSITKLGIDQGAVRDISASVQTSTTTKIIFIVKRWSLFTGLFGSIITLSLAPQLSIWSFGNDRYTVAFYWLACTFLFDTLSKGQLAIFQGLHKLRVLAKANLTASTISLIITIPIYYIWGTDGIVPSIIISYISIFIATTFFYKKENIQTTPITFSSTVKGGLSIIHLGIMLTISSSIGAFISYLFNIYLSKQGGITDVGLYQAGFNLIDRYIGVIFLAMSMDYYPRLSTVHQNNKALQEMVNQQTIINLLILCPVVCIFIPTAPIIVRLLLSEEFLPVIPFLSWGILGMIFKVSSTTIGYIQIVKGNTKMFLTTDAISFLTIFISNIIGYHYWGIEGIGIAFLFGYLCYFIQISWCIRRKYRIKLIKESNQILLMIIILSTSSFLTINYLPTGHPYIRYIISAIIFMYSVYYAYKELNKKINIKDILQNKRKTQ